MNVDTLKARKWTSYIMCEQKVIKCSMKHIFHHNAVVTKLKYYCKQRDNVDVVENTHSCLLLQFVGNTEKLHRQVQVNYHILQYL